MTKKEIKQIAIGLLKEGWVKTDDNLYYISELRTCEAEDLERLLSEIESNATLNADMIQDLIDEI